MITPRTSRTALLAACAAPLLASPPARAADSGIAVALQGLAGLGAVLALIIVFAMLARRLTSGRFAGASLLRPVASIAIGTRERVVIVELGEQWLVLGVTASSVNLLHSMPRQAPTTQAGGPAPAGSPGRFASLLAQVRGETIPRA